MYLDEKGTIWGRYELPLGIDKGKLIKNLEAGMSPEDAISDVTGSNELDYDHLIDTFESLEPRDNDFNTTIELIDEFQTIWKNCPSADDNLSVKQIESEGFKLINTDGITGFYELEPSNRTRTEILGFYKYWPYENIKMYHSPKSNNMMEILFKPTEDGDYETVFKGEIRRILEFQTILTFLKIK
jgi:hypothetical protein